MDKRPESNRSKANKILLKKIKDILNESGKVYGSIKIRKRLNDGKNKPINHKRIERIMSERMTKGLVINALDDAYNRAGRPIGIILHSDRGPQYCSMDYPNLIKKYGFVCSMSRKGNCWDNAPMESFCGKMKCAWLYEKHFETHDEARADVFEYVEIFYNRQRIHASNGYITPEQYYNNANKQLKIA